MISGTFDIGPVNKSRHYVLAILPGLLLDHFITNQGIIADTVC